MASSDWAAARAAMLLDPAAINLNTGSFGPLSRIVFERVTDLRRRLAEEPMDFLVRAVPPLLWKATERLAAVVGGAPPRHPDGGGRRSCTGHADSERRRDRR